MYYISISFFPDSC